MKYTAIAIAPVYDPVPGGAPPFRELRIGLLDARRGAARQRHRDGKPRRHEYSAGSERHVPCRHRRRRSEQMAAVGHACRNACCSRSARPGQQSAARRRHRAKPTIWTTCSKRRRSATRRSCPAATTTSRSTPSGFRVRRSFARNCITTASSTLQILDQPDVAGTPGTQNSTYVANVGPTYENFIHGPAVPAASQPATVTVAAADPDGVASMTLYYSVAEGHGKRRP